MEMNGLRAIVQAIADGDTTLHAIRPAPAREDYPSDKAWEAAYADWQSRVMFWKLD